MYLFIYWGGNGQRDAPWKLLDAGDDDMLAAPRRRAEGSPFLFDLPSGDSRRRSSAPTVVSIGSRILHLQFISTNLKEGSRFLRIRHLKDLGSEP